MSEKWGKPIKNENGEEIGRVSGTGGHIRRIEVDSGYKGQGYSTKGAKDTVDFLVNKEGCKEVTVNAVTHRSKKAFENAGLSAADNGTSDFMTNQPEKYDNGGKCTFTFLATKYGFTQELIELILSDYHKILTAYLTNKPKSISFLSHFLYRRLQNVYNNSETKSAKNIVES